MNWAGSSATIPSKRHIVWKTSTSGPSGRSCLRVNLRRRVKRELMKLPSRSSALLALALTSCACSSNHPEAKAAPVDAPLSAPSAVASAPPVDAKPPVDAPAEAAKPPPPPPLVGQDFID